MKSWTTVGHGTTGSCVDWLMLVVFQDHELPLGYSYVQNNPLWSGMQPAPMANEPRMKPVVPCSHSTSRTTSRTACTARGVCPLFAGRLQSGLHCVNRVHGDMLHDTNTTSRNHVLSEWC